MAEKPFLEDDLKKKNEVGFRVYALLAFSSSFRSSSTLSVLSQVKSGSSLPKCPNTAVFL